MDRNLSYVWDARHETYAIRWHDTRLESDIIFHSCRLPEGYEAMADVLQQALGEVLKHRMICPGPPMPDRCFGTRS